MYKGPSVGYMSMLFSACSIFLNSPLSKDYFSLLHYVGIAKLLAWIIVSCKMDQDNCFKRKFEQGYLLY